MDWFEGEVRISSGCNEMMSFVYDNLKHKAEAQAQLKI
jgi:hypothetical protein